ncbi:PepSY domain-containing protein [Azospirillum sp. RWY-5-1]|uniref:PepSY domain-containing protein n=1 Tax=Azospirillum oleiclasticum TaxID=2735135 RepID=A0ABX2T509_9PROT|nr:PepSY domain-containing protein [Azospirillum oleiclasticum]NYZ12139.1 PepSY domain-containing protein [Azospirillum oleiclasticum]NYZ19299.1 PepSY domain-containing protein [Azospirillum oleiclasticum]
MTRNRNRPFLAVATGVALTLAGPAGSVRADDHDRARAGVQSGELLPLRAVLDRVERDFVGRVLDVELEEEDGAAVYEIEILASGGRKIELVYDARSGRLLKAKGRDLESARRKPGAPP